jgi:hypothetical protein
MAAFSRDALALFEREREVDIETRSAKGAKHSVVIWVVVDGNDVFVRSYRGATGRWYRELRERSGAIVARGKRFPVRALAADDAASISRASDALRRKYARSSSLAAMLRRSVLDTTLRLEPAH